MSVIPVQTKTPCNLGGKPDKEALINEFKGKPLNALRTPAAVIDRAVFAQNCAKMHENAKQWGASFRAHVKTHKVIASRLVHDLNAHALSDSRGHKTPARFQGRPNRRRCRVHIVGGSRNCKCRIGRRWNSEGCEQNIHAFTHILIGTLTL